MTKLTRWECPVCADVKLAPRRARRLDTRIYCLGCSAKSPRLVRRVRLLTSSETAAKNTAATRQARKARERARRRRLDQTTQVTIFKCGWRGLERAARNAWMPGPVVSVVEATRPRRPRITQSTITFYDTYATDFEAKAVAFVAIARWGMRTREVCKHCDAALTDLEMADLDAPNPQLTCLDGRRHVFTPFKLNGDGKERLRNAIRRIGGFNAPIIMRSEASLEAEVADILLKQAAVEVIDERRIPF